DAERSFYSLISRQGRMVAGRGHEIAAALREAGENLRHRDSGDGVAGYVVEAADGLDEWMKRLEQEDPGQLFAALDDAARRRPAVVFGGALGIGFLLSRFMRSSGERALSSDEESPAAWGAGYERVD